MQSNRRAFTIYEIIIAISVLVQFMVILMVMLRPPRANPANAQLRDSTQIRGIHQGMILFAQNNADQYPVPSQLDKAHTTLTAQSAKDDLGNTLSILLYNGFFSPELAVSPAERSKLIRVHSTYALINPPAAVKAANGGDQAQWDPAFRGSGAEQVAKNGTKPLGTLGADANVVAHNSYALVPYFGARRDRWSMTFDAGQAVIGNRGPSFELVGEKGEATSRLLDTNAQPKSAGFTSEVGKGTTSVTLGILGDKDAWQGNIAFNDNHVEFLTRPDPENIPFRFNGLGAGEQASRPDNLFISEHDDTVTPLPAQLGTVSFDDDRARNPIRMKNNWLKTWTVSSNTAGGAASAITIVVD